MAAPKTRRCAAVRSSGVSQTMSAIWPAEHMRRSRALLTSVPSGSPWSGQARPVHVPGVSSVSLWSRTCARLSCIQVIRRTPRSPAPLIFMMVVVLTSRVQGCAGVLSVHRFPVGLAFADAFQYPRGGPDLRSWRLQDGVPADRCPGGESRAEVGVVRVLGGQHQALPLPEPVGERPAPGGQVPDPLAAARGPAWFPLPRSRAGWRGGRRSTGYAAGFRWRTAAGRLVPDRKS